MKRTTLLIATLFLGAMTLRLPHAFAQGPLTPPGAPAPTMKTLAQIEPRTPITALPFTVTAPGSYYLAGSLTAPAAGVGIVISADNVTIDLGGFEVIGPGGAGAIGIRLASPFTNAVIRNGTVRNWAAAGISSAGGLLHLENVRLRNNTGAGVLFGVRGSAIDCVAEGNGATGFSGATGCRLTRCAASGQLGASSNGFAFSGDCILTECAASGNASDGFGVGARSLLRQCIAISNTGDGITGQASCSFEGCVAHGNGGGGIVATENSTATGCAASSNGLAGFSLGGSSALAHCAAYVNTGSGIQVGEASTVAHCTAFSNGGTAGIDGGFGCTISDCTARSNTSTAVASWGIFTNGESTIIHCTVTNTGNTNATVTSATGGGISAGIASLVRDCTVQGSKGDGIRVSSRSTAVGNNCDSNGLASGLGAGIRAAGSSARIDGNHVTGNGSGVDIDGVINLVIRNTANLNATNYVIAAGNRYGPIIDITANNPASVTGNTAPDTSGSTHPWANFAH